MLMHIKMRPASREFLVSIVFIGLLVIPSSACSVSFGALVKKGVIDVNPGDTGRFEILFYSRSEETTHFQLSLKEYPQSFTVAYPDNFDLDSEDLKDEYVLISGEYVKGKVVWIDAGVPSDAEAGEYDMLLYAVSSEGDGGNLLNVNADKTFLLRVNVPGESESQGTTATTTTTTTTTTVQTTPTTTTLTGTEEGVGRGQNGALSIVAFALIVVFLILAYLNYKNRVGDMKWW